MPTPSLDLASQALPAPRKFLHPEALTETLEYLRLYIDLTAIAKRPEHLAIDPAPTGLLRYGEHGSITGLTTATINGHPMVGVSLLGANPRFLLPLDFVAVRLSMAFGLPLTLQKTGGGLAYPRFRAASSVRPTQDFEGVRSQGWNIYLLRAIADAGPWQIVRHLDPLSELEGGPGQPLDHHYLGRDALALGSVQDAWADGKKARVPKLGREALRTAALHYFDLNAERAGLDIPRNLYAQVYDFAWDLADWRYGRVAVRPRSVPSLIPSAKAA